MNIKKKNYEKVYSYCEYRLLFKNIKIIKKKKKIQNQFVNFCCSAKILFVEDFFFNYNSNLNFKVIIYLYTYIIYYFFIYLYNNNNNNLSYFHCSSKKQIIQNIFEFMSKFS